ncbi:MAG: hypothetical protein ACOC7T_05740 [Planctomycetota bacterium]
MNTQNTIAGLPRDLFNVAVRFAAYTALLVVGYGLLPEAVVHGDIYAFKEGGFVEWCQLAILAVTAGVFAFAAWRIRAFRQWFSFLALAATLACMREFDSFFDALLPLFGWQTPAFVVLACMLFVLWRSRRQIVTQAGTFVRWRGFALLWAGFVVVVVFAQLVGHSAFLEALMGDDYVRDYKRVIEELGELFGYALMLAGSIETFVDALAFRRGASHASPPPRHQ